MADLDINKSYFTIASICDQFCIDLDLATDKYFNKVLSWALFGLTQIKLDTGHDVKTVLLDISDVNTCKCPADFIDWTKVAVQDHQYIRTLAVNSDLSKIDRTAANVSFRNGAPPGWLPNGTDVSDYGFGYIFSNYGGRQLQSIGGGLPHRGYFQVVKRSDDCYEIILDTGLNATQIYLEYIALGINPCGETTLNPYYADYVRNYLHHQWERFQRPPMRSESAIMRTGRDLDDSRKNLRGRTNDLDKDTLLAITRQAYRLTNKA